MLTALERHELRRRIDEAVRARRYEPERGAVDLPEPGTPIIDRLGRIVGYTTVTHGAPSAYGRWRCRCEVCREAANAARRSHRRRARMGSAGRCV